MNPKNSLFIVYVSSSTGVDVIKPGLYFRYIYIRHALRAVQINYLEELGARLGKGKDKSAQYIVKGRGYAPIDVRSFRRRFYKAQLKVVPVDITLFVMLLASVFSKGTSSQRFALCSSTPIFWLLVFRVMLVAPYDTAVVLVSLIPSYCSWSRRPVAAFSCSCKAFIA